MDRFRVCASWLAALVTCAACAGTAVAQYKPIQYVPQPNWQPNTPSSNPNDYQRAMDNANKWWDEQQKQQQPQQASPGSNYPDPVDLLPFPSPDHLMLAMEIGIGVGVAVIALWVGLRAYQHYGRPSDPTSYVLSDPWVQAQLARQGEPLNQPGQEPPA